VARIALVLALVTGCSAVINRRATLEGPRPILRCGQWSVATGVDVTAAGLLGILTIAGLIWLSSEEERDVGYVAPILILGGATGGFTASAVHGKRGTSRCWEREREFTPPAPPRPAQPPPSPDDPINNWGW
jgi:hypothetical protein